MNILSVITSLIASMMLLFMPVFVIIKDWRDQVNRAFALFSVSGFIILFSMFLTYAFPDSLYLTQFNRLSQVGTALTFSFLFVMSLVFPKGEKPFSIRAIALIIAPAFIISYIAMFTDFNITRAYFKDGRLVRDFRFFYTIYAGIVLAYLLLGTGNFVRKYIKTTITIHRLQMQFMFVGTSWALVVASVCSIVLPRFFGYSDLYVLGPSVASFFAFGSLFYSVISYNLMDITTAVHKTVTYAIISTAIFVPLYLIMSAHKAELWGAAEVPLSIVVGLMAVVFIFFSVYLQPVIDRVFKRKQYEFEGLIDKFVREVGRERDFRHIIERSVDTLFDTLFLKRAFFVMFSTESKKYQVYYRKNMDGEVEPLTQNSTVIRWFLRNQEVLHLDRVYTDDRTFGEFRDEFLKFFNSNKIKMILPIYHERRVLGLLCLGEKDSLAAFKPDEMRKLAFFQAESNTHISNALTYEESRRQQMITRTLDLSSDILAKSVPKSLPSVMGVKFGALVIPRYGEGIDYFDFMRPSSEGIGMIATDISGVGINSALYSVVLRSAFQSSLEESPSTFSVIQKLNNAVYDYSEGKGNLITAYYMYYDVRSMRLMYTNAGFPPLELFRIEKNDFDSLDTEGIPLGYDPRADYGMGRTNLLRGDIGLVYSKALITSKNTKGEVFGLGKLRNIIRQSRVDKPTEICRIIKEEFTSFLGLSSPESDIVVLMFKTV
ncbi:MAG TPA: hypothetical protein ENN21_06510 [Spirochaetes bacterium]|nr:hypothetical protein [Spirochaetota bacterium]